MRLIYILSLISIFSINLYAQTYSGGLPLPGLPKSLGPKTMAGSTSVTIATDQTAIPVTGTFTSSAANVGTNYTPAPTSSAEIGYIDENGNLHPFLGDANGITVTSRQGTSPWVTSRNWYLSGSTDSVGVTGTVSSAVTGTVSAIQSGAWDINNITGTVSLPTNAATETTLSNINTTLTNTAVTVTSISNKLPATLGQKPSATSLAVVVASDQSPIGITGTVSSVPVTVTVSSISRVANSASSQTLLSANGNRKQVFLFNDTNTTNCYVKLGSTASLIDFTFKLFPSSAYIMDPPVYTGVIDYICDAASGSTQVTEQ